MFGLFGVSNKKLEEIANNMHEKIREISYYLEDSDNNDLLKSLKDDHGLILSSPNWIYPDLSDFVFHIMESNFGDGNTLLIEGKMKYFGFNVISVSKEKYSVTAKNKAAGSAMPSAKKLRDILAKFDNYFDGESRF